MGSSDLDWFFCITLSILVLRHWWKHRAPRVRQVKYSAPATAKPVDTEQLKRLEYEEELRKQGYSEELIIRTLTTLDNQ